MQTVQSSDQLDKKNTAFGTASLLIIVMTSHYRDHKKGPKPSMGLFYSCSILTIVRSASRCIVRKTAGCQGTLLQKSAASCHRITDDEDVLCVYPSERCTPRCLT